MTIMRKRLLALLCAVLLGGTLLLPTVSAAPGGLFFLSINDTLPNLTPQTTPIQSGGWVYVPANIFSSRLTGVNLRVYYGLTDNNNALVLYNLSGKSVTFDLQAGTATAVGGSAPVPGKALRQNGICYVPAYAVCQFFDLTYSYLSTDYGPLLRIKDGEAVLGDSIFVSSASSMMRNRLNAYLKEQTAGTPAPPAAPVAPPVTSTPSAAPSKPANTPAPAPAAPRFTLTAGLQASPDGNLPALLNVLSANAMKAVVFFPANQVADCGEGLRQAVGQGHRIGLIPTGDTPEARLTSVRAGEREVARLIHEEGWCVLNADKALTDAGYLSWSPGITLSANGSAETLYSSIVSKGSAQSAALRVLVGDTLPAATVTTLLQKLIGDGDTFLAPRETHY